MRSAWLVVTMLVEGCGISSVARHTLAKTPFEQSKREEVWTRALATFQDRGILILVSDAQGGVLVSQPQPVDVNCHGSTCRCVESQQLVLFPGSATLRTNRGITVSTTMGKPDLSSDDEASFQRETDTLLAEIMGAPAHATARESAQAAPQRGVKGTLCRYDIDCQPALSCERGTCQ